MKTSNWTPEKNAALIGAYLQMLAASQRGERFNKAQVRRNLVAGPLAGHSEGSLEFKLMNISGCMKTLGLPILDGYAPAMNYQSSLFAAVKLATSQQAVA